jgi:hypothetical protein
MPANSGKARRARKARRKLDTFTHFFDKGPRRRRPRSARGRRIDRRILGNPALKPVKKTTGWMNGPAGTNTQVKIRNPGGKNPEILIRRKKRATPSRAAKRKSTTKRKTKGKR